MAENAQDESEELMREIEQLLMDEDPEPQHEQEPEHAEQPENIVDEEMENLLIRYAEELRKSRENTPHNSQQSQRYTNDSGSIDLRLDDEYEQTAGYYEQGRQKPTEDEMQISRNFEKNSRTRYADDDNSNYEDDGSIPRYTVERSNYLDCLIRALYADNTEGINRKKAVYNFLGLYTLERLLVPYNINLNTANQKDFTDAIAWIDENKGRVKEQLDIYYKQIDDKMNSVLRRYMNKYMKSDTNDSDLAFINKETLDTLSEETIKIIKDKVQQYRQTIGEHFSIFCSQLINALVLRYIFSYSVLPTDFIEQLSYEKLEYCGYPFIHSDKYINGVLFPGFIIQDIYQITFGSYYELPEEGKLVAILETINANIRMILESGLIWVIKGMFSDKKIRLIEATKQILDAFNEQLMPIVQETRTNLDDIDQLDVARQPREYKRSKKIESKPKSTTKYKPVYNINQILDLLPEIMENMSRTNRKLKALKTLLLQKQNRKKK